MKIKGSGFFARLTVVFILISMLASPGVTRPSKATLRNRRQKVSSQIHKVRKKLAEKKSEQRTVLGRLEATEKALEGAQGNLSKNKLKLLDAQTDLTATQQRLERTKRQLVRRKGLLSRRVVDIYEGNDISFINVLLGSSDMWTFLTRSYYLQQIIRLDATLIEDIKKDKLSIEKDEARQKRRVVQISGLQTRLVAERDRVASLADDRRDQLSKIENDVEYYEKAQTELEAQSAAIEAYIRRYQTTGAGRRRYSRPFTGGLGLPCSGRITSRYGYRVHPITGVYKLHSGVDISVPRGTPVHCSAKGVVVMACRNRAYGNMVVVDHGGGVTTLYGHNSRLCVRVGQEVSKGQIICYSGSTGYSTGPHLHFEKQINGKPVNPL